ncbi:hypothetical protein PanWU01x14_040820, partial [Parasponia andersonii]
LGGRGDPHLESTKDTQKKITFSRFRELAFLPNARSIFSRKNLMHFLERSGGGLDFDGHQLFLSNQTEELI